MKYEKLEDGEWYSQPKKDRICCCDCGLVHDVEWRLRGRKIQTRHFRNARATAQVRRGMIRKGEL
jgi:hypothetical protein